LGGIIYFPWHWHWEKRGIGIDIGLESNRVVESASQQKVGRLSLTTGGRRGTQVVTFYQALQVSA